MICSALISKTKFKIIHRNMISCYLLRIKHAVYIAYIQKTNKEYSHYTPVKGYRHTSRDANNKHDIIEKINK